MSYSLDVKRKLVQLVENGLPIPQAAKQLGVPVSTAYDWIKACNKDKNKFLASKVISQTSENSDQVNQLIEIGEIFSQKINDEAELRKFKYQCTKLMHRYPDMSFKIKEWMDNKVAQFKEFDEV